jgi:integrase
MKHDIRGLRLENDAWVYSYRIAGRARRMTIGHAPGLIPADARKAAQHFAGLVAIGRCPASERKAARRSSKIENQPVRDQVERVAAQYLKHHRARVRASTYRETARVFTVEILPAWRGRRLSEISKQDVRTLVDKIAKRPAPVSANRGLASIKAFFNWAISVDVITKASPAATIRPPAPETARERVLTDDELGAVWRPSHGLGEYGAIVRLLILTGQRRGEVAGMTWAELDLAAKIWRLPAARAKNNRQHVIPLSAQAIDVLRPLCPAFEIGVSATPIFQPVGFSQSKAKLDAELKGAAGLQLQPWTLHDLRRTCASGMASLGVAPHVIEACLNHQSGVIRGVAAVYNRCRYEPEKRAALEGWAAHVANLVTGAGNKFAARRVALTHRRGASICPSRGKEARHHGPFYNCAEEGSRAAPKLVPD